MTKISSVIRVMAVFALALPAVSFGWGREGHEIVARIAEAHLTPHAKAAVKELLGDESLADIASWADEIRQERNETSTWHYIDTPFEMRSIDLARDGKSGNNVVEKSVEFATALDDRRTPRDKRIEALKFFVHFTGDIHQPLHCAERNEDKGGNMRLVFFPDQSKAVNLHKVWDTLILRESMKKAHAESAEEYAKILDKAIDLKKAKTWTGGTPEQWANESHMLAIKVAYEDVPASGAPPKLTDKYMEVAQTTVDEQLQKAGIRLADVLNRIFH